MQLRPRLGFAANELRPIDGIDRVEAPLLLIAGTADRHTTRAESLRLFARAQLPKELWEVPGAEHVDFHQAARAEYEARVSGFLARALRSQGADAGMGGVPVAGTSR